MITQNDIETHLNDNTATPNQADRQYLAYENKNGYVEFINIQDDETVTYSGSISFAKETDVYQDLSAIKADMDCTIYSVRVDEDNTASIQLADVRPNSEKEYL